MGSRLGYFSGFYLLRGSGRAESGAGGMLVNGLGCRYLYVPEKSCVRMVFECLVI